jgi:probable HAF family extracellular repeat protein
MKRSVVILFSLIGFMSVMALVGCGGGSIAATAPNSSPPPPPAPLTITSGAPPAGTLQVAYGGSSSGYSLTSGFSLTASGGKTPYTWSWAAASGSSLPAGLSISTNADGTGTIAGTPTSAGPYSVVVNVTDSESPVAQATANYTIAVTPAGALTITSGTPPNGTVGVSYGGTHSLIKDRVTFNYSGWPLAATGGAPGYNWSWSAAQGSSLPPGLSVTVLKLMYGGTLRCCVTAYVPVIGGTPTAAGTYHVIVTVTDSGSPVAQASAIYTITISKSSTAVAKPIAAPTSQGLHIRYKAIDVGTLGGPNSQTALPFFEGAAVPSLSQTGTFVGLAETSTPDPFNPDCFNSDCYSSHGIKWENGVLTDLGALPGLAGLNSATTWISGNGQIVGFSENGEVDPFTGYPSIHGVVWKHGKIFDLGTLPGGYESVANAVNNWGQVVGFANDAIPDGNSLEGMGSQTRAAAWWNGEIRDLGTLGGTDAVALYINDLGQIVGESYTSSSVPSPIPHCGDSPLTLHAFIWGKGQMTDLKTLGGTCAFAYALNNRGQIAGQANIAGDQQSHPFLWERGVMRDLGALGGTYGYASGLNDSGQVVGAATNPGEEALFAFSWKSDAMTNLGTLDGDACSVADAINPQGQVVGGSGLYDAPYFPACTDAVEHAVLWENGKALDLTALVTSPTDLTLNEATYVNDRGEISGFGTLANGDTHAFVLIPCDINHPGIAGCDYSLMDLAAVAQSKSAALAPAQMATANALAAPITQTPPSRARMANRYRRFATPHTPLTSPDITH